MKSFLNDRVVKKTLQYHLTQHQVSVRLAVVHLCNHQVFLPNLKKLPFAKHQQAVILNEYN